MEFPRSKGQPKSGDYHHLQYPSRKLNCQLHIPLFLNRVTEKSIIEVNSSISLAILKRANTTYKTSVWQTYCLALCKTARNPGVSPVLTCFWCDNTEPALGGLAFINLISNLGSTKCSCHGQRNSLSSRAVLRF